MSTDVVAKGCPVVTGRDERKSAKVVEQELPPFPDARIWRDFNVARDILRSSKLHQGGANIEDVPIDNPEHASFFFLDGEIHRKRRASVAGYFTPKTIINRYHPLMQRTMDELIAEMQAKGQGALDEMSGRLAAYVTMEILGLTNEKTNLQIAERIKNISNGNAIFDKRPLRRLIHVHLFGWLHKLIYNWRCLELYRKDIAPAAEARRKEPKDDVVSYMVKEGYSRQSMIIECLTYGVAGVSTTREFIVMAAWHLFDKPELKARFLNGSPEDQFAIIEEILRLEPVAGHLYRRAPEDVSDVAGGPFKKGERMGVNLRAVNADEAITGACPYQIDPDRAKRMKVIGPYLSFGDGPHRCPGAQVALHETRIFLDRLLRVPGIRLVKEPQISCNMSTQGYELRGAVIACDPA
jgi:cytochrome P450